MASASGSRFDALDDEEAVENPRPAPQPPIDVVELDGQVRSLPSDARSRHLPLRLRFAISRSTIVA